MCLLYRSISPADGLKSSSLCGDDLGGLNYVGYDSLSATGPAGSAAGLDLRGGHELPRICPGWNGPGSCGYGGGRSCHAHLGSASVTASRGSPSAITEQ